MWRRLRKNLMGKSRREVLMAEFTTRDRDFVLKLQECIEKRGEFINSQHLKLFIPGIRLDDPEYRILPLAEVITRNPEAVSFTSPEGVWFYTNVQTITRDSGLWLDEFAKGVSSVAFLVPEVHWDTLHQMLQSVLNHIEQSNSYPMLAMPQVGRYAEVAVKIMENGEAATCERLLAYNYGVWWMIGHLQDFRDDDSNKEMVGPMWLQEVLSERAEQGIMEYV